MNSESTIASTDQLLRSRLPEWLGGTLAAGTVTIANTQQLVGGHSNETWKVDCTYTKDSRPHDLTFVIRWGDPDGIQAPYDIPGQFGLLSALSRTSVPVPTPLWLETDPGVIGAPFLAMELAPGITPNRFLTLDDPDRDRKMRAHAEMLARIHGLDWKEFGIDKILPAPTPEDCASVAVQSVRDRGVQRGLINEPWVQHALSWLAERMPARSEVGLLHGDPNLTNYRLEGAQVVAVLDWDAARLSDPLWDVGAISGATWLFFADQPQTVQEREREKFLTLYHDVSSRSLDNLQFWETLFVLRASLLTYHPKLNSSMSETLRRKLGELTSSNGLAS